MAGHGSMLNSFFFEQTWTHLFAHTCSIWRGNTWPLIEAAILGKDVL